MEEENHAVGFDNGENTLASSSTGAGGNNNNNHGWQKVVSKRNRKQPVTAGGDRQKQPVVANGGTSNVFASIEQKGIERRRAIEAAQAAAAGANVAIVGGPIRSKGANVRSDDSDDDSGGEGKENGATMAAEAKKVKQKKPKKPKVTVAEAASKIDAADLAAFLAEVSGSYETQPNIQLMRFADYFGRAFASVSASQFPWTKMFKESPVAKIVDIPLCHISAAVYKTSADWVSQRPLEAIGDFVLWCLDSILVDLASHQAAAKGSKKSVSQPSSKGQVAIFVVLAMTLRRKPDVLITLLPKLRDNPKFQGLEKLPVIIWTVAQASQGDLVVGMYIWAHFLLPSISGKLGNNPQARDLILQLVERTLSAPKARPILLNGAVRKGERVIPPSALDLLMRATFPTSSSRVKATERFEVVYPFLKELALAGSPGMKTTKQASQQLLPLTVKSLQENNPELTGEATDVFIWCLTQNADCYHQWEKLHLDNVAASVAVLRKLCDEWKVYSTKLSPPDNLKQTLKCLRDKNAEVLSADDDTSHHAAVAEADKYCKTLLSRLTGSFGCGKCGIITLTLAVAAGALIMAPQIESIDFKELLVMLNVPQSN